MDLDQFIAAMLTQHRRVLRPTDPPPPHGGWYVVATDSEYVDGGFSLRVTDRNNIITEAVKYALGQIGFEVRHASGDDRMEAWPIGSRSAKQAPSY